MLPVAATIALGSTLLLIIAQEADGEDAPWSVRATPPQLSPLLSPSDVSEEDVPTLQWWLPRMGVSGIALCGVMAPVLPVALVPLVVPPSSAGTNVGRAYGQLEVWLTLGQVREQQEHEEVKVLPLDLTLSFH